MVVAATQLRRPSERKDKMKISVIGGDLRIVKLVQMLSEDGFDIKTFALEKAENISKLKNVKQCDNLKDVMEEADIIVGPIPLSSNKKDINTPFSNEEVSLEELINSIDKDKLFIAGSLSEEAVSLLESRKIKVIDLLKREELAVLNTISTAEGAIQIAMEETYKTIHGSKVLVVGFGRIGKILAKMLQGIGAKVYCEARKNSDLAWIKAYGYSSVHLSELSDKIGDFDIIINTVPALVIDKEKVDKINEDCVIIDLASNPGGVDKEAVKRRGLKLIWALSLPGKVAPITSAEFIKETIYNILKEL